MILVIRFLCCTSQEGSVQLTMKRQKHYKNEQDIKINRYSKTNSFNHPQPKIQKQSTPSYPTPVPLTKPNPTLLCNPHLLFLLKNNNFIFPPIPIPSHHTKRSHPTPLLSLPSPFLPLSKEGHSCPQIYFLSTSLQRNTLFIKHKTRANMFLSPASVFGKGYPWALPTMGTCTNAACSPF